MSFFKFSCDSGATIFFVVNTFTHLSFSTAGNITQNNKEPVKEEQVQYEDMEGAIPFNIEGIDEPCYTWYKVYGDLKATPDNIRPLVLYPGGPGACHEYLLPLVDLYEQHRIPLVFYDPVGNGKSSSLSQKAEDVSFWTPELFEKELHNLVNYLGLHERGFDFFGHSWGGMLGSRYAASHPKGLRKLVLANTPSSVKLLNDHDKILLSQFPQEVQEAFEKAEKEGRSDSDEYQQAAIAFYKKHLCRADPWPTEMEATLGHLEESKAYQHM
jgi:L-proline amide hydrolase